MPKPVAYLLLAATILACPAVSRTRVPTQTQSPSTSKPAAAWPADMKGLFQEIAGDYTFDIGGQSQILQFRERDGSLFGSQNGESQESVVPVKDKPLHFEVTVQSSGSFLQLEFVRDDKGIISKCILTVEGTNLQGLKIIR